MASERRIKLTPAFEVADDEQSYRVTVTASDANLMSNAVFVLRRQVLDAPDEIADNFDHVATPLELDNLPVDEPAEDNNLFRSATLDLTTNHASDANDFWLALVADVDALRVALDSADTLQEYDAIWIGTPP